MAIFPPLHASDDGYCVRLCARDAATADVCRKFTNVSDCAELLALIGMSFADMDSSSCSCTVAIAVYCVIGTHKIRGNFPLSD